MDKQKEKKSGGKKEKTLNSSAAFPKKEQHYKDEDCGEPEFPNPDVVKPTFLGFDLGARKAQALFM